ncbi:MAG: hypothetical protein QXW94_02260 [Desulfurococcaceae archaeon]
MGSKVDAKKAIGILCTLAGSLLMAYEFAYVRLMQGAIGRAGTVSIDTILVVVGFHLILIGPALWLGETPLAIRT